MRSKLLLAMLLVASMALAKGRPSYQKGVLLEMQSVSCGYSEKSAKTVGGVLLGTDSARKNTHEMLCQEYVLQTDRVIYRIRPKEEKHPMLLPVGETAEFRLHKDKLLLRVPEADDKEREYIVVAMTPRSDVNKPRPTAQAAPK